MAVEEPAALGAQPWKAHLERCAECREARYRLERSLAVFRQFEAQPRQDAPSGPSWEAFSLALSRSRRQRRFRPGLRVPLAAASLLVAVSSGMLLWPEFEEQRPVPSPATIVTLRPEQQMHLRHVLQSSLGEPQATRPNGRVAHETPAAGVPAPARFVVSGLGARGAPPAPTSSQAASVEASAAPEEPVEEAPQQTFAPLFVRQEGPARREGERAPVLLFRSLQQRRTQRPPVQVLPVFAPMHLDGGSSSFLPLLTPRPIR